MYIFLILGILQQILTASAPRFRHSSHRVWKVIRGVSVSLNCDVEAAPKARVSWVDADDADIVAVPGKLEVYNSIVIAVVE